MNRFDFPEPPPHLGETRSGEGLRIFLAYDTVASGQRAVRALFHLTGNPEGSLRFYAFPWRLDLLANPTCGMLASVDAHRANVFVISASNESNIPTAAVEWFKENFGGNPGSTRAVITLVEFSGNVKRGGASALQNLWSAATEAGLDFFSSIPLRQEADQPRRETFENRPGAVSEKCVDPCCAVTPNRHWGINE